ncbi:enamine deaminase RidA (YjgF/YER057c/UK114 family) [Christiangramia gaetbulicola]|uniref:Enamine deaminase RidA (YjgF/YER057c/UK114 family) n=1 Tax=Christiangramia gaetbulicola TaxID=703340 RepID=A0A2T6AEY4_9FLAO|nr:RidA family protein [Christiangramia gaetbulicola]PTX42381.1 enamine deaminase RidA (YjgF/YER057c/UK114 family) [Christiangramia gaetbulicola]
MKKQIERSGAFQDYIAEAVKAGNNIYISGQVSLDDEGNLIGENDMKAQVDRAYHNIAELLEKFNLSMDNIVDETWFVTNVQHTMENIDELFEVRHKHYGKFPEVANTLVEVKSLVMPELMIEIKCIAQAE